MVVMHSVSDFTECIPIKINIKTSKQIHTLPFPAHLLMSIVVYLATARCSWIPCIFLITLTSDTEICIANLMYYFTYFNFLVSSITIIYFLLDLQRA